VLSVSTASPDRDVYKQGEDASPIIGLKAAIGAINEQIRKPFEFHFVEESGVSRPHRWPISRIHRDKSFQDAYEQRVWARLQVSPNAATFALVDPFGWTGIPMSRRSARAGATRAVRFDETSKHGDLRQFHVRGNKSLHQSPRTRAQLRRPFWMRRMALGSVKGWLRAKKVHCRSLP
jgi:hypothetical protein